MADNDRYLLGTLNKAFSLIELFSKHAELGISEIGRARSLSKSNTFRLVLTLQHWGFLEKTPDSRYRLGTRFVYFGTLVLQRQDLIPIARPHLQKLRDLYNETTHMAILTAEEEVVFLVKESATGTIQMISTIGARMPAYATANGKVLLAFSPTERVERYLRTHTFTRFTRKTIGTREELLARLDQVSANGYGEDDEESEIGLTCYAAPVRAMDGTVVASVSISGPTFRMVQNRERLIDSIRKTAADISRDLGWRG
jgi:IclR family KDG regulon transcriptional repressor